MASPKVMRIIVAQYLNGLADELLITDDQDLDPANIFDLDVAQIALDTTVETYDDEAHVLAGMWMDLSD